ncbi:MAG: hypothetical protein OWQ48_03250 [Desulfurococcus sp.]|nr:hypothetical protein [Desulfurococcus sp.]
MSDIRVERYVKLVYISNFTALAVVLKFFEIPFPLAPFLKYDFSGIPLMVLGFRSLKWALLALPAYYVIPVVMGSDPIGMAMKVLAEAFTFTPFILLYRRLVQHSPWSTAYTLSSLAALLSRTALMTLVNLAVTPLWLMLSYPKSYPDYISAFNLTLKLTPYIAVFNATLAVIVLVLTAPIFRILARVGLLYDKE